MEYSGQPDATGNGDRPVATSSLHSNSGYIVPGQSPSQMIFPMQYNHHNGNSGMPRYDHPFGNGGNSRMSYRGGMNSAADQYGPLLNSNGENNGNSNQFCSSRPFQSLNFNQMSERQHQQYQQLRVQAFQNSQHSEQLSMQHFTAAQNGGGRNHLQQLNHIYKAGNGLPDNNFQKTGTDFHRQVMRNDIMRLEPQMQDVGGLTPFKWDQSLSIQQQPQLVHLSRQHPNTSSVPQMNITRQLPLIRLQEQQQQHQQQRWGKVPDQQMPQLHQGLPKGESKTGICAPRLMLFINQQRKRPQDNNILFWRKLVAEYFTPDAKKKLCVSMHGNVRQPPGVFRQDVWHCEICKCNPGYGLETTAVGLPRLFQMKYESGTLDELLYLDMPVEDHTNPGQIILCFGKAIQESVFDRLRVVHDGQLRVIFSADLKISSWEFCVRRHEELIPRRVLKPHIGHLGDAVRNYQAASQPNSDISSPESQINCNMFVSLAQNMAEAFKVPLLHDLGYTKRYVRCLQISEVVHSMIDLFDYSRETGTGPMDSLVKFPRRVNSQLQCNGLSRQDEYDQTLQTQVQPNTATLSINGSHANGGLIGSRTLPATSLSRSYKPQSQPVSCSAVLPAAMDSQNSPANLLIQQPTLPSEADVNESQSYVHKKKMMFSKHSNAVSLSGTNGVMMHNGGFSGSMAGDVLAESSSAVNGHGNAVNNSLPTNGTLVMSSPVRDQTTNQSQNKETERPSKRRRQLH